MYHGHYKCNFRTIRDGYPAIDEYVLFFILFLIPKAEHIAFQVVEEAVLDGGRLQVLHQLRPHQDELLLVTNEGMCMFMFTV